MCRSGNRSGHAVSFLRCHGFNNLRNFKGGMIAVRTLLKH
ncbi:rhodanese-like domain-containing protein [bacterium]|nr:rhodanese-like domain-containing protein [bacterium]